MAGWEEWLQGQASTLVDRWSAKEFKGTPPYNGDVQAQLRLAQLGEGGYYIEGQAGTTSQVTGMSTETKVLLGAAVAAVLLVVVLKD